VEHNLTEKVPHRVQTRFELAIRRMVDAWLEAGRMEVSAGDVKLAREFLEHSGCRVEDAADARLLQALAEGAGQIRHLRRVGDPAGLDPLEDLLAVEGASAQGRGIWCS